MQVVVNHQLIKRNGRLGKVATAIGLAAMGVGLYISLNMASPGKMIDQTVVVMSYAVLIVALVALSMGRYYLARWSRRPRVDEVLAESMKGFDPKSYLFSYLPGLPVEHLMVTPRGLVVILAKHIVGEISNSGDRWRRKTSWGHFFGGYSEGGLGNPTQEGMRGGALVQARVAEALGADADAVPVSAIIVFTDSRAKVQVENAALPVVEPKELRNHIRALHPEAKLSPERVEQLANLFAPDRGKYVREPVEKKVATTARARKRARVRPQSSLSDMGKMGRNRAERRMK